MKEIKELKDLPPEMRPWPGLYPVHQPDHPMTHEYIWLWRQEWGELRRVRVADIPQCFNIIGVWWMPWERPELKLVSS